jgi:c(7)-type cytochrome triheme protein
MGTALAVTIRNVVFTTKPIGKVVFSHDYHLQQTGLTNNCRACHDAIFNMRKKTRVSMAKMAKGSSCGACHDGRQAFALDNCVKCHPARELQFETGSIGRVAFSHKSHLEQHKCAQCHPSPFQAGRSKARVSMQAMAKGKSCGACHNGKQAFALADCVKCHPVQELLFVEKSTGNVVFSHKSHLELNKCGACHPVPYKAMHSKVRVSMQAMENGKSCGACHDGKTAFSVKDKCEACHKL